MTSQFSVSAPEFVPRTHMAVVDPFSRKLMIPLAAMQQTRAVLRAGTPSLCILYLNGRCRQGRECHQVHADPAVIEQLRTEAANDPTCCAEHNDPYGAKLAKCLEDTGAPPTHLKVDDVVISFGNVAYTLGIDRHLASLNGRCPAVVEIPSQQLCRLHAMNRCRFCDDCKFVHICREAMAQHFPEVEEEGKFKLAQRAPPGTRAPTSAAHPPAYGIPAPTGPVPPLGAFGAAGQPQQVIFLSQGPGLPPIPVIIPVPAGGATAAAAPAPLIVQLPPGFGTATGGAFSTFQLTLPPAAPVATPGHTSPIATAPTTPPNEPATGGFVVSTQAEAMPRAGSGGFTVSEGSGDEAPTPKRLPLLDLVGGAEVASRRSSMFASPHNSRPMSPRAELGVTGSWPTTAGGSPGLTSPIAGIIGDHKKAVSAQPINFDAVFAAFA